MLPDIVTGRFAVSNVQFAWNCWGLPLCSSPVRFMRRAHCIRETMNDSMRDSEESENIQRKQRKCSNFLSPRLSSNFGKSSVRSAIVNGS